MKAYWFLLLCQSYYGVVPEDEVSKFCEYDWGVIEELDESIKIDVNSTLGFFSNGMGAYVAINGENCINENSTLWFKNKPPKYNVNF
ncbi:hypothetical protein U2I54_23255 [Bacillus pseudomycoides]|uniref:Uncharacterized protein n=1 Tax=Bacillus bingmayongensis TaxID=1150157 RepID=A0ABU5K2P9_9BACI|nr:hypothetical protein [Bacillus pseudomycoides]